MRPDQITRSDFNEAVQKNTRAEVKASWCRASSHSATQVSYNTVTPSSVFPQAILYVNWGDMFTHKIVDMALADSEVLVISRVRLAAIYNV